ncbi:hypothetical protein PHMEG_00024745 [Phytophthora megakarya]|uniref:Uncharacterized protein n=1 Tax=Phytophthora megakarya TaxID=4795 RepID=A0A225VDR1_9STRA|nr:hypothetical protein PHMEG_00024745 [Phytophthora megakarya]
MISVKNSYEPGLLDVKKNNNSATDDRVMQEIQAIVSTVTFGIFDSLVEEEGLEGCFEGKEGTKERSSTLRDNIKSPKQEGSDKAGFRVRTRVPQPEKAKHSN